MNVVRTELEGVLLIEPRVFQDARGLFFGLHVGEAEGGGRRSDDQRGITSPAS